MRGVGREISEVRRRVDIPGVRNDNVVKWCVSAPEAGEAHFDDHGAKLIGVMVEKVLVRGEGTSIHGGFSAKYSRFAAVPW